MAQVVITFKIMPNTVDTDLKKLEKEATNRIENAGGAVGKTEIDPIAFGLNALKLIFIWPESKGSTEKLEEEIKKIKGVMSVSVIDVRRAIG